MVATSVLADSKSPGSVLGLTHTDVRNYKKQHHGNYKDMEPGQGKEGGVESTGLL